MANKKKSKPMVKKQSTQKQADNMAEAQLLAKFGETIESVKKIIEEKKEEEQAAKDQSAKTGK